FGKIELIRRAQNLSTLRIGSSRTFPAERSIRLVLSPIRTQALPLPNLQHTILYSVMKLCFAVTILGTAAFAQDFDVLIVNGRIVDGTGNPSYRGDVGIRAGKIIALGRLAGRTAGRPIDANGLVVAPGFVDIHNHSDYSILTDGDAQSMV